jgi:large subunit ribosomal protein L5
MAKQATAKKDGYTPRLMAMYEKDVRPSMQKQFNYKNPMQVPKLDKIVINMGVGENVNDSKTIQAALADMAAISGQKPVATKSKKAIAGFKLREGLPIGCKVTLRKQRMYEFLDRLINTALPRVRDFRGVPHKSFDGRGNYALGLKEQIVFRRSTTTRSTRCAVWTSSSAPRQKPMPKPKRFSPVSTCRLLNN